MTPLRRGQDTALTRPISHPELLGRKILAILPPQRYEKRNSFRTGDPENSGFSNIQLREGFVSKELHYITYIHTYASW